MRVLSTAVNKSLQSDRLLVWARNGRRELGEQRHDARRYICVYICVCVWCVDGWYSDVFSVSGTACSSSFALLGIFERLL